MERSSITSSDADLEAFYDDLAEKDLAPLWTAPALPAEPHSKLDPYRWRWKDLRPLALRALELVGTQEAERRVILCVNPGTGRRATNTLAANVQIVGPGEIARAHRHTMAALRMIVESSGGYTVVNGDRIPMLPGDLVLTPNGTWHDHANDSDTPTLWLDGLDAPLVGFLEATFQDAYPTETQQPDATDRSLTRYGSGSVHPAWNQHQASYSPLWHYPWIETKRTLDKLAETESGSTVDGVILEYTNPATGGSVMPTIACHVQVLKPGQQTTPHRHTSSTVYQIIEGQGASIVGGMRLGWESKDVLAIPGWAWHEHINDSASEPAYLFSFTDRPVFEALGLYREEIAETHNR